MAYENCREDGDIENSVRKRYEQLKTLGILESAASSNVNSDKPPVWYDAQRFARSQTFANKYYLG